MRVLAVIPARMESTRLPGKPLAMLGGKPMVVHVLDAVRRARVDHAVVATDSPAIHEAVLAHGGSCVMTRADHATGTDRVAEVAAGHPKYDAVLNVQGDEPLISPEAIDGLMSAFAPQEFAMATLAAPLSEPALLDDPHTVKVAFDAGGRARTFSRHPLDRVAGDVPTLHTHIGVYLFRRDFLLGFADLPASAWERRERLEQLRALDAGFAIQVVPTDYAPLNVDTPEDLERVRAAHAARSPCSR
ncbi:MAG: 3-deoxy-manno-octulosonate cytidylyltransferase [Deltaproteobacteria bacterium]|nr:3-deoxy-manno-octulosonate cytidylyltransferase [Deltaproteobacteria bacterium]